MKKLLFAFLIFAASCKPSTAPVMNAPIFGTWIGSDGDTIILRSADAEWRCWHQRLYADSYTIGFNTAHLPDSSHKSVWLSPDTIISLSFMENRVMLRYCNDSLHRLGGKDVSACYTQP